MRRISLFCLFIILTGLLRGQNVFDPNDTITRHKKSEPLGSPKNPDPSIPGLQKWVSTPTIGVSAGTSTFDASSFKQYFINFNGTPMAFRLKFPYSYNNPDSANKKYPINLFLHGGGEVGCNTNGGVYNNEKPLWLGGEIFRDRVDNNLFDGFLLYPQYVVQNGCFAGWGSAPSPNFLAILAMVDSMAKYIRADIDRLVVDGLSGGGYGAWRMVDAYPQRVAKIIPSAAAGNVTYRNKFVHIPIWFATGGKDLDPSPATAQNVFKKMKDIGADIRYTLYPERGHSVWYQHWREPDFVDAMNDAHKANPLVFFQRSEFCREEDVNAKLGITAGFFAYEWQRDGVTIATATNGANVITDPLPVSSFTGNEITVRLYGTYRVRFKRTATSDWSAWSMKPAVIGVKGETETLPITVNGQKSRVLPALDGSNTVPLTLAPGFINYQWYRTSDDSLVATTQTFDAPVGEYKAKYEEEYGCGNTFSPPFTVVDANGSPKPEAVTSLTAVPKSQSSIQLNWPQVAGETGFELYRSTVTGGPYQFVALIAANLKTFIDTGLVKNTLYFYKVRAVSETGAAVPSNESTAKTLIDNSPPTAPSLLQYVVSTPTAVRLTWKVSTDNERVSRYDIYVNQRKLYSAFEGFFVVSHLDSLIPYNIVVRAVDAAGNVSAPSNQVTYVPPGADAGEKPGTPSEPQAVAIAHNKIEISWADTIHNETGFEVVRATGVNSVYSPVATVDSNVTRFTDSGLVAAQKYYYRIRAIGRNGESPFSAKVNATTLESPETPEVPPQLLGEAAANGSVSLTWTDDSDNETGYKVYKSEDGTNFTLIAALPANSNAYTDSEVTGFSTYYYYVIGLNSAGDGAPSNTLQIRAGNNAPVITDLDNIYVKAGAAETESFNVADDAGDQVTVTIQNKPSFVTLTSSGNGDFSIQTKPTTENTGTYNVTVTATDNNNRSSSQAITITVGDQKTRSVFVNFGSNNKAAPLPWNNWLGLRGDGDVFSALKDENNAVTPISISMVNGWSGLTDIGHITGNNSGVFPDAVLQSGLADNQAKQIKISGLNRDMQYNLVFVSSQNEGINAEAEYTTTNRSATLNARYNTNEAGTLSSIVPDENGEILVTLTPIGSSPYIYLNGVAIQEYAPSIVLLNPDHLVAEAVNRSTVRLTWSDRTHNETMINGYQLVRATDSMFTKNVEVINLPGNSHEYTNTGLAPDTKYWFRVRAAGAAVYSDYSKRVSVVTPATLVYVNFNVTVEDAESPWNNLATPPLSNFTTPPLKDQSGKATSMTLTLEKEFNGEFTAGVNTGNNSGIVPDRVLGSNYWLDKDQIGQFKLSGLNHGKRYRVGFIGSSSPPDWFKGDYTATYTINNQTVYLNSWMNSSKIVYINDVAPDPDGKVLLNFSTTKEAGYGFNSGIIIQEYTHTSVQRPDTTSNPPVDTLPGGGNPPPVDTLPGGGNPPPVDTLPGGGNPPPVDTIPGGQNPPPVDTIPGGQNPPPVDTIPGGQNPPPVDTLPGGGNPPPVDTLPGGGNPPPVDTLPGNGNTPPVDTLPGGGNPPPVDSIPPVETQKVTAYPNPFQNSVRLEFDNKQPGDKITVEIYDAFGRLMRRENFGTRPVGSNLLVINGTEALRKGIYWVTLKINAKTLKSVKIMKVID